LSGPSVYNFWNASLMVLKYALDLEQIGISWDKETGMSRDSRRLGSASSHCHIPWFGRAKGPHSL
jgi:hypothetical protein